VFQTPEHKTDLGQKNIQSKAARGGYDMHIAQLNSLKQAFLFRALPALNAAINFPKY